MKRICWNMRLDKIHITYITCVIAMCMQFMQVSIHLIENASYVSTKPTKHICAHMFFQACSFTTNHICCTSSVGLPCTLGLVVHGSTVGDPLSQRDPGAASNPKNDTTQSRVLGPGWAISFTIEAFQLGFHRWKWPKEVWLFLLQVIGISESEDCLKVYFTRMLALRVFGWLCLSDVCVTCLTWTLTAVVERQLDMVSFVAMIPADGTMWHKHN